MSVMAYEAATPEALQECGRRLARTLPPFAVLVLVGELGAGKTTLMKGIAEGWSVARPNQITSPTYTLIHEFQSGRRALYHIDLYRIETPAQLATLGLEELLQPPPAGESKLVAIEWGERIEAQLPRPYLRVALRSDLAESRHVTATWKR